MKTILVFSTVIISCLAQRSFYADRLPMGLPYVPPKTDPSSDTLLQSRFGEKTGTGTTIKLPLEALGDAELVRKLLKLPVENQPFWLVNSKAIDDNRNSVQNYPQQGNGFIDSANELQMTAKVLGSTTDGASLQQEWRTDCNLLSWFTGACARWLRAQRDLRIESLQAMSHGVPA